jgi:hypothetical protein
VTTINDATDQTSILESLTKQYKAAAKKSCGAYIKMAETVVRADEELTKANRALFCKGIGLDPKGSTVRKMRAIGKSSARFKLYLALLPANWTTLWQLTKRTPEELERLKASGVLHPHATWAELKAELGGGGKKKKDADLRVYFDLTPIAPHRQRDFLDRLTEVGNEFDVRYQPTKASKAMIARLMAEIVPNGTNDVQEREHEPV